MIVKSSAMRDSIGSLSDRERVAIGAPCSVEPIRVQYYYFRPTKANISVIRANPRASKTEFSSTPKRHSPVPAYVA
eukprot:scaffold90288_cov52-Attheya_sp.AAC.7